MKMINTKTVPEFRKLRFDSIEDCVSEVDRIAAAGEQGSLRTLGNWTPGQILSHVASWIEYAYDGFPVSSPPFFVRWILRWQLRSMLRNGMPRGVRIPGVKGGTTGMDDVPTAEAARRLVLALERLKTKVPAKFESPAFGPMSVDDRIQLNLRHAELHLGFLSY